jgi:hypothetical protein
VLRTKPICDQLHCMGIGMSWDGHAMLSCAWPVPELRLAERTRRKSLRHFSAHAVLVQDALHDVVLLCDEGILPLMITDQVVFSLGLNLVLLSTCMLSAMLLLYSCMIATRSPTVVAAASAVSFVALTLSKRERLNLTSKSPLSASTHGSRLGGLWGEVAAESTDFCAWERGEGLVVWVCNKE